MKFMSNVIKYIFFFTLLTTSVETWGQVRADTAYRQSPDSQAEMKRGREILRKIASLNKKAIARFNPTNYQNEIVSFTGISTPPEACHDLLIENGFYLRIVNPEHKDLRPQAIRWEVWVRGKVLNVLPENKIIVLQVEEKDWHVQHTL
jgi:hypothetical protein